MSVPDRKTTRVAFQGEPGAFSEAAAVQLLGDWITTVPCPTFDAAFRAVPKGAADALLVPVENSLAGSVVRVYDLLLESDLGIVAETILPIEHQLIGCPGATLEGIRSVASHPMALHSARSFFSPTRISNAFPRKTPPAASARSSLAATNPPPASLPAAPPSIIAA
jgi:prephenate dehydratase